MQNYNANLMQFWVATITRQRVIAILIFEMAKITKKYVGPNCNNFQLVMINLHTF